MKHFNLTIITENQKTLEKGNKLGKLICECLEIDNSFEIEKYHKFPNSYRLIISGQIKNQSESIFESIELTDRICEPWTISYKRLENEVELVFNKSDFSNYRNIDFNVIKWANFEIEK